MNRQRAEQLLYNALQPHEDLRSQAEAEIKDFLKKNYTEFLGIFGEIMFDPQALPQLRQISSIIIRNTLHATNKRLQITYEENWLRCPEDFKTRFKDALEMNLNVSEMSVRWNITRILGSIIRIELSHGLQYAHFERLYSNISDKSYAIGILETVSVACDQLYDEANYTFGELQEIIFKLATYYHNSSISDTELARACLKCICSTVEVYPDMINDQAVRKEFFSQLLLHSSSPAAVLEVALDALNRFVDAYPILLKDDIPYIATYILSLMKGSQDDTAMRLFEFWEILIELKEDNVIVQNISTLLPILLSFLVNEDPEDRAWTEHKAASSLLASINDDLKCNLLGDSYVQNYIRSKLFSSDSSEQAIASIALGCVCNTSNPQFISEVIDVLIYGITSFTNEALYSIGRICEKNISSIHSVLPKIIESCKTIIHNGGSINAIWVINHIASSIQYNLSLTSLFDYHYSSILTALVNRLNHLTLNDSFERNILIETLSKVISMPPKSETSIIPSLVEHLSQRIRSLAAEIKTSSSELFFQREDMLSSYIVLFQTALLTLPSFQLSTSAADIFVLCLETPESAVHGEVFLSLSKLVTLPGCSVLSFIPYATKSVQSQHPFVSRSALNFISDCAVQAEGSFSVHIDSTVSALITAISSSNVSLDIKPHIIEVFGDIALAVGVSFEPYIEMAAVLFSQIITLSRSNDEEYVDSLRAAVLRLFSCIFISLNTSRILRGYIPHILNMVNTIASTDGGWCDNDILDLLNDMYAGYGPSVLKSSPWVLKFLESATKANTSEKAMKLYRAVR